jgi:hypothetical protein
MLELNITKYFEENDPYYMSGSVSKLGANAACITWENSLAASDGELLTSEESCQDTRDWIREFGAWSEDEINSYTKTELEAFILQSAASEINDIMSFYEQDYDNEEILSTQEIIELIINDEDYRDSLSSNLYVSDDKIYIMIC